MEPLPQTNEQEETIINLTNANFYNIKSLSTFVLICEYKANWK